MKKKIIAVAAILAVPFAMTSCGRTTINLNDYLSIDVTGYNTIGEAHVDFDSEALVEANKEAFGLGEDSDLEGLSVLFEIEDAIDGELDKDEGLSNGDKVTFTWDESGKETLEEKYEISLKYEDKVLDVAGLKEAEKFNPFDYVSVSYQGFAPNGEAVINVDDNIPVSNINFTADKKSGLKTGDTIKITIGDDIEDVKDRCFVRGYIPVETEKEYTVEGLASYIQKLDEIPTDAYDKMDNHAQDVLKAHVADTWGEAEGLIDIKLIGNYLLTPKDPSIRTNTNNTLYYIYKVTAKDLRKDDKNATFDYYYYSYYSEIVLLADGTCSFDLGSLETPDGSMSWGSVYGEAFAIKSYDDKDYFYQGYEEIDSLFNKHVTAKIGEYNYESTVKE